MAITIENLTKYYGTQKAVDNISFTIKTGEVVGFLGPNGAGKSTTMKMITCYLQPSAGEISLDSFSASRQSHEIKKRIGYLPENNPLYLDMPIVDYLRFCAELQCVPKKEITARIRQMIDIVGLNLERYKKIGELSKGYRQRVGLAQALIHNPEVLILDEPTTGLDPNQIIEIRNLIKELGKDKTVILSSHILPEVEATCDRILIINRGKIVADGTPDSLRNRAKGAEQLTLTIEGDPAEITNALAQLPTVDKVQELPEKEGRYFVASHAGMSSRKEIFNLCVAKNWCLLEMYGEETSLEDVFRELTQKN